MSVFEKKVALTNLTCNQVKTQQGVPSQPSRLEAVEVGSTTIRLRYNSSSLVGKTQVQVPALLSLVEVGSTTIRLR